MNIEKFNKQLNFIIEIDKLKQVFRKTILLDSTRNENDAEHSWHMSIAGLILLEYSNHKNMDILKILKMILIHDIVEINAGDTFIYGNYDPDEKLKKEKEALEKIFSILPEKQAKEYILIWNEFEENKTPEANYAKALDRFMPILHNYITKGKQWKKYNVFKKQVLEINEIIKKGSNFLWEYVKNIIEDSTEKGYLLK